MRRRRLDAVLALGSAVVLVASALLARRGSYHWEAVIFQAFNDLPGWLRPGLWLLNQYGTAVTIPVVTASP
ncbi:MAG: hypothetical protein ACRDHO_04995 [Actinomycetota bacterium]